MSLISYANILDPDDVIYIHKMFQRLERIYPFILISCKIVASFLGYQEFPLSFNEREEAKSLFAQINPLHKIEGFPTENLL